MIKTEKLSFGYRGHKVFRELDLEISKGNVYGLLGKNGSGKSTLLKLISGLVFAQSGEISTLGSDPRKRLPSMLREIYFLPEEFDLPRMSIVEYADCYGCFYPKFSIDQMLTLLRELEVDAHQNLHKMSMGQKKKAMIAFAIACNTSLLLMDEPTNGLDIPSKSHFRRVISSITNDDRIIIISTHQVRDLDQLLDSIIILEDSDIVMNVSVNEIVEKLAFVQLEKDEEAIYSEQSVHGRWGVKLNDQKIDSPLDLELLFNAVMIDRKTIKMIFNNGK